VDNGAVTQTNTNNINKAWALLQTTRGKDEPNIVFMQKNKYDCNMKSTKIITLLY